MSGTSLPFSKYTHYNLYDHQAIFKPVLDLYSKTKLKLRVKDPDSYVQVNQRPSPHNRVNFVFVLDDNKFKQDGRILMETNNLLQSITGTNRRSPIRFKYYPGAKVPYKWQLHLRALRNAYKGIQKSPSFRQTLKDFYYSTVQSQGISLTSKKGLLPTLARHGISYINRAGNVLQSVAPDYILRFRDPQSTYSLVQRGNIVEFTLSVVGDQDSRAGNGRLFMNETLVYNSLDRSTKYNRHWHVALESKDNPELKKIAGALNLQAQPSQAQGTAFLKRLLPLLLKNFTPPPPPLQPQNSSPQPVSKHPLPEKTPAIIRMPNNSPQRVDLQKALVTFNFPEKSPGLRRDNLSRGLRRLGRLLRSVYERRLKKYPNFSFRNTMFLEINNRNGNIRSIKFRNIQMRGDMPWPKMEEVLRAMAKILYRNLSLKKHGHSDYTIKVPMTFNSRIY